MKKFSCDIPLGLSCVSELEEAMAMMERAQSHALMAKRQIAALRLAELFLRHPSLSHVSFDLEYEPIRVYSSLDNDLRSLNSAIPTGGLWSDAQLERSKLTAEIESVSNEARVLFQGLDDRSEFNERVFTRFKPCEDPVESAMRQLLNHEQLARWQAQVIGAGTPKAASMAQKKTL